jgi:hypothetical protein
MDIFIIIFNYYLSTMGDVVDKTEQSLGEEIQSNVEELKRQEKTQKINKIQQQLYNNRNMIKETHNK